MFCERKEKRFRNRSHMHLELYSVHARILLSSFDYMYCNART